MNKALFLSLALLTSATLPARAAELNIRIPTPVAVGALAIAGTVTAAFSLLSSSFAWKMAQEESHGGQPDKMFLNSVTIGSGLAAITSGIVSYMAFKNACQLLK